MKFTIRSLCAAMTFAVAAPAVHADDLLQIYQQALTSDPVVLQAKAQRDALYESIAENRAPLLPTISGNVGFNRGWNESPTADTHGFIAGVSLNQIIYDHSAWVA